MLSLRYDFSMTITFFKCFTLRLHNSKVMYWLGPFNSRKLRKIWMSNITTSFSCISHTQNNKGKNGSPFIHEANVDPVPTMYQKPL